MLLQGTRFPRTITTLKSLIQASYAACGATVCVARLLNMLLVLCLKTKPGKRCLLRKYVIRMVGPWDVIYVPDCCHVRLELSYLFLVIIQILFSIVSWFIMSHSQHAAKAASTAHEDTGEAARLALFAIWQVKDQKTAWYFGVAMAGLVIIFTIAHWLQLLFNKRVSKSSALSRCVRFVAHPLRRINKATIFGGIMFQPGITILAIAYFGINAGLTFYDHPERIGLTILAKRFGWYVSSLIGFQIPQLTRISQVVPL